MKTLYFECNMGAAGDMIMAALLELHPDPKGFLSRLNNAGIPKVAVTTQPSVKLGVTGTHVTVMVNGLEEDAGLDHDHDESAQRRSHENHGHTHEHGCSHENHRHEHEHGHGQELHANTHEHSHENHTCHDEHSHNHEHHEHAHEHSHEHTHENEHNYEHLHDHHHGNGHGEHIHDHHTHAHTHDHSHGSMHDIQHLIESLSVSDTVKKNALKVYKLIAEAESRVHGVPVTEIHFHEVGTMDAVADIVGVCMLIDELAPEQIMASPINVGSGQVRCAHGILPVPAPATAHILKGVPIYSDKIKGELCTPTGAALLKHFVDEYCQMPVLSVTGIGYGMGKKDFEKVNCVRAFIGDTDNVKEDVVELICNLDDMTPEAVAFAQNLLFQEGALDVYVTPIIMKKGRAGQSFTCMCRSDAKDKMISLIFKHTTTLGIREYYSRRYALKKEYSDVQTKFGAVKVKTSYGYGTKKSKPEYEDIARIARETGKSIKDVLTETGL